MPDEFDVLKERLREQNMTVALRHLELATIAFERREWESSNAQLRSFLEALFNEVASLRLDSTKRGGAARKALEDAGLLREKEARLVQAFMAVAGGEGSHAGVSNEDEAQGRFLVATGIALIGLAVVPSLTRVEDVIIGNLKTSGAARLPRDTELRTSCPTCGREQTLAEATIRRDGEETVYDCTNGCQTNVVVGTPGDPPWPGRGYRIGDHVIGNATDLHLPVLGTGNEVLIPASPASLMKRKPTGSDEQ